MAKPAHLFDGEKQQHQHDTQYRDGNPKFTENIGHALTLVRESCSVKGIQC